MRRARDFVIERNSKRWNNNRYLCARKYVYAFWCFIKRANEPRCSQTFTTSYLSCIFLFLSLLLRLSCLLRQRATRCITVIAAHSTYLSIIFTVEGILIGAQLRRIDGWQVHRHWFGRQEGHRLRGHVLRRYQLTVPWKRCACTRSTHVKVLTVLLLFSLSLLFARWQKSEIKAAPNK